jgi:hypothetical protein
MTNLLLHNSQYRTADMQEPFHSANEMDAEL